MSFMSSYQYGMTFRDRVSWPAPVARPALLPPAAVWERYRPHGRRGGRPFLGDCRQFLTAYARPIHTRVQGTSREHRCNPLTPLRLVGLQATAGRGGTLKCSIP